MMSTRLVFLVSALSIAILGCGSGADKNPVTSGGSGGSTPAGSGGATSSGGVTGTGGVIGTGGSPATGNADASVGPISGTPDAGTAPGPDSGAPSEPTSSGTPLETLQVPASGDPVMTKALAMGQLYLLRASGAVDLGGGQKVDAEYVFGAGMPTDEMGTVDPGVDVGLLQIHAKVHTTATPPGPGRMKWSITRPYRDDHVYYMTVTGEAKPLTLKLTKATGATAATGTIAVSVFQLSPMPTGIGAAVDSVDIPFVKMMVLSKPTIKDKQYLLQSSGEGHVSTNGLGDSEYMDYDPAGTRFNEGESGADFGLGVDESGLLGMKVGAAGYLPRTRWWGTWRMDHTYYMTFTGTGMPIQLIYFDSGYGDNRVLTDHITLKIFEAP
jgi:hypothetical protein